MTEPILAVLFVFIKSLIAKTGYGGIVILMGIESACIPLPSELIMPFAGYLVYTGRFNLWAVAAMGALGCNLGSLGAYLVGYYGGRPLVERYGSYILLSRREQFAGTLTEKLLTYSLGRELEYYDFPAARKIMRETAPNDYRWSSIILGIVKSVPFQMSITKSAVVAQAQTGRSKQ